MHTEPDRQRNVSRRGLDAAPAAGATLTLTLMDPTHVQRGFAEAFVSAVFRRAYDATLSAFYPLLLGLTHDNGEYAAVAGIRPAGADALFSNDCCRRSAQASPRSATSPRPIPVRHAG